MTRPLRIVLLTGNGLRHHYVAQRLTRELSVTAVLHEAKSAAITSTAQLPSEDKAVVDRHFAERDAAEQKLLAGAAHPPQAERREIPNGTLNSPEVFDWVRGWQPDYLVLYGSGLLKAPLLDFYAGRVINLHLGLSPYYRGSGTNFWPLVNGEPECVGATIHLAVPAVDAGAILAQVRPSVDPADRVHEPGTRTIMAAADLLPRVLAMFASGQLRPREQTLTGGRVYRNKDFNAGAVREAWRRLDAGMMRDYAADRAARCARFPIVEFNGTTK